MEYFKIKDKYITFHELTKKGLFNAFTLRKYNFRTVESNMNRQLLEIKKILSETGIKPKEIYSLKQVHSDEIKIIESDSDYKEFDFLKRYGDADGFITNSQNILLITKYADCIPIVIFDEKNKVQANVHSGWRGTSKKIAIKTINKMQELYNSRVEDLLVVMGPAIGKDDFEVREDVFQIFLRVFPDYGDTITKKDKDHWTIDTKEINIRLLEEEGVLKDNIFSIDMSTYVEEELHSYRRDRPDYGLMACFTMIL